MEALTQVKIMPRQSLRHSIAVFTSTIRAKPLRGSSFADLWEKVRKCVGGGSFPIAKEKPTRGENLPKNLRKNVGRFSTVEFHQRSQHENNPFSRPPSKATTLRR